MENEKSDFSPDTALYYNSSGNAFVLLGEYEKALTPFKKALIIRRKILGVHPDTAISYGNVARIYFELGNTQKALRLVKRALSIQEILGLGDPATATNYGFYGLIYYRLKKHHKAIRAYKKALAIQESIFGTENMATTITYKNIGDAYERVGELDIANEYREKYYAVQVGPVV